ncbi:MAG: hypothetical protein AB1599_07480 [Planctomycetota bacterium]
MELNESRIEVVDDKVAEILRAKTPVERVAIGLKMWHSTTILLTSFIRSLNPGGNEDMVRKEVIRRMSNGAVRIT